MSDVLKIFLKIIQARICKKCEELMGKTQLGFRGGFGTREALLCIKILIQNCKNVKKNVFICFIDYDKAFDTIRFLYWQQTVYVSINYDITEEFISRGVRQGCILSPLLFNVVGLYSCGFPRGGVT